MEWLTNLLEGNNAILILIALFLFKDQIWALLKPKPVAPPVALPLPVAPTTPAVPVVPPSAPERPVVDAIAQLLPVIIPLIMPLILADVQQRLADQQTKSN